MKVSKSSNSEQLICELLRWIGRNIPNIPYIRAIPNRLLKPLHSALGFEGGLVDVLGFKMYLEPTECVDGNLWFAPHLYDRYEIRYLQKQVPQDCILVDVGANIGFWSLCFSHTYPKSKICAIEANPETFYTLLENIEINGFQNIIPINVGVSDCAGELPLYCNDDGNRGADSFSAYKNNRARYVMVMVEPLLSLLVTAGMTRIDVLKMDIEGFEERVLVRFFAEAPRELWPRFICLEVSHVPQVVPRLQEIGYDKVLSAGENFVFKLLSQ
jgi:FkbM family methyltransferase